jgi:hypothetical protein
LRLDTSHGWLDLNSLSSTTYTLVMKHNNYVCSGLMLLKNSRWFT